MSVTTGSRAEAEAFLDTVTETVRTALGGSGAVALHEPCFRGREWEYVKDCLDTGWVSSVGAYVDRFEAQLTRLVGCRSAVATCNGTAALHVCLILANVRPGDEVLVPSLSFVATANAVAYAGAVPHFVDCDEVTLGVDPEKLAAHLEPIADVRSGECRNRRSGRRIAALMPVHLFGHPCRIEALVEVADRFGLAVVEDAAESIGSTYRGRHTGRWGRLSALSFNGNKIVTTGGGGAILTDDPELGALAKHLTTTARVPHRWEFDHDRLGYNYRLPNINAALGCAQLEQLPGFIEHKRALAERYRTAFAGMDGVHFVAEPPETRSNYWLCTLLLEKHRAPLRDELLRRTNDAGIGTRPAWKPLATLPMYRDCPSADLTTTQSLASRVLNLPSSPWLWPRVTTS